MRVAFIMHGFDPGQQQMQFLNYARYLPRRYRLLMLFIRPVDRESEIYRTFEALGAEIDSLECTQRFGPGVIRRMYRRLRAFRPDIVHTQHAIANVNGKLTGALYQRFENPGLQIICEQRNAKHGIPRAARMLEVATLPAADLILCSSAGVERSFFGSSEVIDTAGLDLGRRRHYTFHNSIDVERFAERQDEPGGAGRAATRRALGLPEDAFAIATVAKFSRQKDYPTLIEAFGGLAAERPQLRLLCVGDGPEREKITAEVRERGLSERVLLAGYRDDVPAVLAAADCFVLASLWEGLPKALLEAMSLGRACVATRVEGNEDVIVPEQSGLLVPPGDPAALAAALGRVVDEPELREALERGGQARVREFGVQAKTAELDRIYRRLAYRGAREPELTPQDLLLTSARAGLALQAADGSMPAGNNGTWGQPETPVRATAHWAISFLAARRLLQQAADGPPRGEAPPTSVGRGAGGEAEAFRRAAERCLAFVRSDKYRSAGYTHHALGPAEAPWENGLIGPAWVMEALLFAAEELGREELAREALELFLLHPQDPGSGLFFIRGVDGTVKPPDATFNHQAWFAAMAARIAERWGTLARSNEAADAVELFLRRLFANLKVNRRMVIEQKVKNKPRSGVPLKVVLRQGVANSYNRWVRRSLYPRSVGYISFSLHGLAMLREFRPAHPVWRSRRWRRFRRLAARYIPRERYFREATANRFAFQHNLTGAELPYAAAVLGLPEAPCLRFWAHQVARHWDSAQGLLSAATEDPETLAARVYECVYLLGKLP